MIDVIESPTIFLSNTTIAENNRKGSSVGVFNVASANGVRYTFAMPKHKSLQIVGTKLLTKTFLDFEKTPGFTVRVTAYGSDGSRLTQTFAINVIDINERPTSIALSKTTVLENQKPGTLVGLLSAKDQDAGSTLTFSLLPGYGDNASFSVVGNQLVTAASFTYSVRSTYRIVVRVTDEHGATFDKVFTIRVLPQRTPAP